ncbi:MAG: Uma2 family endonuclease [Anaerolineae bacterium]
MVANRKKTWTVEEYLAFERSSDTRHEFLSGEIFMMAGASERHILITGNTFGSLYTQFRKRDCRAYATDMRVKVSATGLYTYPDIVAVCGTPRFADDKNDMLLNPTLIVEVLSPSTKDYDRGEKFFHYRTLESFQEYLLVAQDSIHVEHYSRNPDNTWLLEETNLADATISLKAVGCTVLVADLYEKVTFEVNET